MPRTRSDGWTVSVDHPETDRTLSDRTLSNPQVVPSINGRPRIRIPVPASEKWLALPTPPDADTYPQMDVSLRGVEMPIDELRGIDDDRFSEGVVVLEGVGGVDLESRTTASFDTIRRHEAARQLIEDSPYGADVDDPVTTTRTDQLMQLLETTSEFEAAIDRDATTPLVVENDTVEPAQTSWCGDINGPLFWDSGPDVILALTNNDGYNNGSYAEFTATGQWIEFQITNEYEIPLNDFFINVRAEETQAGETVEGTITIDGDSIADPPFEFGDDLEWDFAGRAGGTDSGTLSPGDHIIRFTCTTLTGGTGRLSIADFQDDRWSYNFDDTLSSAQGWLDGPEDYPPEVIAMFTDALSAFAIISGEATIGIDDTTENQYLQVSNDRGDSWLPDDGTQNNTTTVDVDFPDDGEGIRGRVALSRYSPNGAQDATPRFGYSAQTLSSLETRADIEEVLLLIDEDYDDSLESVLNQIAGDEAYVWSYNLDDSGTPQISWTQPGQRTADRDPDIGDISVSKDTTTYPKVVIKGSPTPVSGERFTASESFVDLEEAQLLGGSETVYDPSDGTNYERESDYRIDRENGQIRIVGSGDMSAGTTYAIDYRHEIAGSYTDPNAPADPNTLVREIPGVTSQRQAEQVAFVLVDDLSEPRYTADLMIPREEATFDALEALSLANLDLPADAVPLEPRGEPEITPEGLSLRLGSRGRVEELLSDVAESVSNLERRV